MKKARVTIEVLDSDDGYPPIVLEFSKLHIEQHRDIKRSWVDGKMTLVPSSESTVTMSGIIMDGLPDDNPA